MGAALLTWKLLPSPLPVSPCCTTAGGASYIHNAKPGGPAAWAIAYVVRGVLRGRAADPCAAWPCTAALCCLFQLSGPVTSKPAPVLRVQCDRIIRVSEQWEEYARLANVTDLRGKVYHVLMDQVGAAGAARLQAATLAPALELACRYRSSCRAALSTAARRLLGCPRLVCGP